MQDWHALGSCASAVAGVLGRFLHTDERAEARHDPEGYAKLVEHMISCIEFYLLCRFLKTLRKNAPRVTSPQLPLPPLLCEFVEQGNGIGPQLIRRGEVYLPGPCPDLRGSAQ